MLSGLMSDCQLLWTPGAMSRGVKETVGQGQEEHKCCCEQESFGLMMSRLTGKSRFMV